MKSKRRLISSIVQIICGILAIVLFVIFAPHEVKTVRWIITLSLAVVFVVMGIIGIIDYKSNK
mgnify:CR=1 FL=1